MHYVELLLQSKLLTSDLLLMDLNIATDLVLPNMNANLRTCRHLFFFF